MTVRETILAALHARLLAIKNRTRHGDGADLPARAAGEDCETTGSGARCRACSGNDTWRDHRELGDGPIGARLGSGCIDFCRVA